MKLMFPKLSIVGSLLALFVLGLAFNSDISAQSKKAVAAKKAQAHAKDAKNHEKAKASAKNNKKGNEKQTAKEKEKAKKAEASAKKDPKKAGESKRASAERRRKEEERRQAILAEQRRREQAAREARARKLAFEHGLRTETVTNISHDVTDGEDLTVRAAAINALGSHAGSVVVMEAQTGKVLTIVNQDWAVRSSIRPCSTIKARHGRRRTERGRYQQGRRIDQKIARPGESLDDAVAFSDNGYFQSVGANLGNTKLVEYAKDLGLGEPTGLNMPGEVSGRLPTNNNNARIYSHGDDTEVSTIQLAVMVSAITNGGTTVCSRAYREMTSKKANSRRFIKLTSNCPSRMSAG